MRSIVLALPLLFAACGPKKVTEAPPPVGWHAEEGWAGQCYFPPDFEKLEATEGVSARRLARQTALEAMMSQWKGERDDGVSFSAGWADNVETVILGAPEKLEPVSQKNLEHCKQVMGNGASTDAWGSWLRALPDKLTAGECLAPLVNTYFDYLEIGAGWQLAVPMCAGDVAVITATQSDKYRVTNDGAWITTTGIEGLQANGDEPCTLEGCWVGMLVGRYVTDDGHEEVFPIGAEATWTAIAHGTLSVSINDRTFFDNTWFKSGGIEDHTGITIAPME